MPRGSACVLNALSRWRNKAARTNGSACLLVRIRPIGKNLSAFEPAWRDILKLRSQAVSRIPSAMTVRRI